MQMFDGATTLLNPDMLIGDEFEDLDTLIQVITIVVPRSVRMPREDKSANGEAIRMYAFTQKAVCLKDFAAIMESKPGEYDEAKKFFLDVAHDAWKVYNELRCHQGFAVFTQRPKKKPVIKDRSGRVIEVALGVVFPVLSALGNFARKNEHGNWELKIPTEYELSDLIQQAKVMFDGPANCDPAKMGKDPGCYIGLHGLVNAYLKYRSPEHAKA